MLSGTFQTVLTDISERLAMQNCGHDIIVATRSDSQTKSIVNKEEKERRRRGLPVRVSIAKTAQSNRFHVVTVAPISLCSVTRLN